jgi:1,2-diacylglycerol 3-alpha-glucosyltransferase
VTRVAIVFYNIGPYHHARLNAAAEFMNVVALEWSAREAFPWGRANSHARYAKQTLLFSEPSNVSPHALGEAMNKALRNVGPQVVAINGWGDFGSLQTLACVKKLEIPAVLMSESSAHDEPRVWWKEWVKRRIVELYSTALVGGSLHSAYLEQLGMPAERIFTGYDVVDNEHFQKAETLKIRNAEIQNALGTETESGKQKTEVADSQRSTLNPQPSAPFFLASARFIEKKNLPSLIRAYAGYRESVLTRQKSVVSGPAVPWSLVILGDGPLKPDLSSLISNLSLQNYVLLPGFKQYDELPWWYARAGAFVHASTSEQWGLVVNEAAAAGLPLVVSNRCGCAPELVKDGVNGFTFDPANVEALANCLSRMAALSAEERIQMGASSRKMVEQFEPSKFGKGLLQAAKVAMQLPRKKMGLLDRVLLKVLSHR